MVTKVEAEVWLDNIKRGIKQRKETKVSLYVKLCELFPEIKKQGCSIKFTGDTKEPFEIIINGISWSSEAFCDFFIDEKILLPLLDLRHKLAYNTITKEHCIVTKVSDAWYSAYTDHDAVFCLLTFLVDPNRNQKFTRSFFQDELTICPTGDN